MGISAAKTIVLSKGDIPKEMTTSYDVKVESFEDMSMRLRQKQERRKMEVKGNPIMEWRAEKPGKKSSFLQDILTHNE